MPTSIVGSSLAARAAGRGAHIALLSFLLMAVFVVTGCGGGSSPSTPPVTPPVTTPPATLSITTSSLPDGQLNASYSASLAAGGGTTPYSWALTSGNLPTGLSLNAATGAITGTPTQAVAAASLTFKVTDTASPAQTKSVALSLTIAAGTTPPPALSITTSSLPNGQAGVAYTATLAATGGSLPYSWSLTGGTLPAGLALNGSGAISGTPTAGVNATSLTFTVTDSSSPVQTKLITLPVTIFSSSPISVSTASLPNAQVNVAYNATLAATGGTVPYTWSVSSGTLPAGLALNSATGTISGTPTTAASSTPFTLTVADSSSPVQTKSIAFSMIVYAAGAISVSVSRQNAGLTVAQTFSIAATTTDASGVSWSATGASCTGSACGTFSPATSLTGVAVTYTPPSTAGVFTVMASSVTNSSINASANVGVTDLAGVTTYHNNLARTGADTHEYALNTSNVATTKFGKLFSCTVDAAVYAQPLWMPNLTISSAQHNIVLVATQNDSVYAFDADSNTTPCTPLWHASLLDSAHGANAGETSVPSGTAGFLVGHGAGDITPEIGITGTPVIDPLTNTLYVVSKSVNSAGSTFYQRLHALDLTTGNEKLSGPVNIAATYPGNGDHTSNTTFTTRYENQRCGLALVNGVVYIAWAGHEDSIPFYGWMIGYKASDLSQVSVFNADPNQPAGPLMGNAQEGGIWMSGGAPAADSAGNLYLLTGNGIYDPTSSDYGDSLVKLSAAGLTGNIVAGGSTNYFTPSDQQTDWTNDQDFGAGGALVVDLPANGSNPTQLVIGGGKDSAIYVLDRTNLGGLGDGNAWQKTAPSSGFGMFVTPAFWNSSIYFAPSQGKIQSFTLSPATATLTPTANSSSNFYGFPGAIPSVSSMPDNTNGIVWALDISRYCTMSPPNCGPAVLHAYDATNLSTELWNSSQTSGDAAGNAVKFTVPTVANGRVYVGTRGNNIGGADNSTSKPGELDVYGLLH
ncbi:MAG TPA: putative Ig domain-containing protein [Terracidiphilus sp.]|nr:putative Ig domain-containing protein [Terracidiphilus sp.]